jgi:hypothetical protein
MHFRSDEKFLELTKILEIKNRENYRGSVPIFRRPKWHFPQIFLLSLFWNTLVQAGVKAVTDAFHCPLNTCSLMRKSRTMLKLQYVGDKYLNLYDGTGSSTGSKRSISAFNRLNHFTRIYQKFFIFRTPTNNGFFSGTMASEIRSKVYLLKIDEIYSLNLPISVSSAFY